MVTSNGAGERDLVPGWPVLAGLERRLPRVVDDFRSCLSNQGFHESAAVPLTAKVDPTVRFVGSVMNVLKPLVLEGRIPRAGVLLAQPALRTMNLKEAHCA